MPKRRAEEDYESDGGFVDDAPKAGSKKVKTEKNPAKGSKDGPPEWELSSNKRVQISEFKGKQLIDIRETYEKDGRKLPGKKGIALSVEPFQALVNALPDIILTLQDKGVHIKLPEFSGKPSKKTRKIEDDEEEGVEEDEEDIGEAEDDDEDD